MALVLRCDEIVPGCADVIHADTEEEVIRDAAEHARHAHGLKEIDAATVAKVKAAIRSS